VTFHTKTNAPLSASRMTLPPSLTRGNFTLPILILVLALGISASGCNKGQAAAAMPTPEVEVAR